MIVWKESLQIFWEWWGRPLKFEYAEDILDRPFSESPFFIFVLEKGPSPFEVETLTVGGVLLNKEEAIYVIECGFSCLSF